MIDIEDLEAVLAARLEDKNLDNQDLARAIGISERQLYRKTKEMFGVSPNQFIRSYRLKRAMEFIKSKKYLTVQEIATKVGYQNVHYFSKTFLKEFGESPMQVLKRLNIR